MRDQQPPDDKAEGRPAEHGPDGAEDDTTHRAEDASLSNLLAQAMPRAPKDFAVRVVQRVESSKHRGGRRILFIAALGAAAAAAIALAFGLSGVVRPGPVVAMSGWRVLSTIASTAPQAGTALADGATIDVGDRGQVLLADAVGREVTLREGAAIAAHPGTIWLSHGPAELTGDGATANAVPAKVSGLGVVADVQVEVFGSGDEASMKLATELSRAGATAAAALGSTVLSVYVVQGHAAVQMPGALASLILNEGDRSFVSAHGPIVTLRAKTANGSPSALPVPLPAINALPSSPPAALLAPSSPTPPESDAGFGSVSLGDNTNNPAASGSQSQPSSAPSPGGLDTDIIRRVIHYNLSAIKDCYSEALAIDPDVSGKMAVSFEIAADGKIDRLDIVPQDDPVKEMPLMMEQCVLVKVAQMSFPMPEGGGVVDVTRYPFSFQTSEPSSAPSSEPTSPQ